MFDSKAIQDLRKRLGMTATEMARLLGVTWSTVCYWERGERHPSWKHLVKLNELAKQATSQPTQPA